MSIEFLDSEGLSKLWQRAKEKFVAKEADKCLSDNNYTDEDRDKLKSLKSDMSLLWEYEVPTDITTYLYPIGNHSLNLKRGRLVISCPEIQTAISSGRPVVYTKQEAGGKDIVVSNFPSNLANTIGNRPVYVVDFEVVGHNILVVNSYGINSSLRETDEIPTVSSFSAVNYRCSMNLIKTPYEKHYALNSLKVFNNYLAGTKIELWGYRND